MARRHPAPARKAETAVAVHQEITATAGPLPPPEALQKFEDVLPGLADRITSLAEGHARNAWKNDKAQRITVLLGQTFAFLLGSQLILGGVWLIGGGHPTSGLLAIGAAVASLVAAFVKRR